MNYPLYNKTLCPDIWNRQGDEFVIKQEIRDRLTQIVDDLLKEKLTDADVDIKPTDVVLVGSSTNYNWTPYSDLDIHIVIDPKDLSTTEDEARVMFDAIRSNWNKTHNISVKGHDVEISFELVGDENSVTSIYSLQNNKWIEMPKFERPTFNKAVIKQKHKELKNKINKALKSQNEETIREVLEKLYIFRQAGLDKNGEFSEENIVFKILRAQGYVDKLKQCANVLYDKEMTLTEVGTIDDGISSQDGKTIEWMYDEDEGDFCIVPTDDDHQNRVFSLYGTKIFAAYRVMPTPTEMMKRFDSSPDELKAKSKEIGDFIVNLRHAIKDPEPGSMSVLEDLIDLSMNRLKTNPKMNVKEIDVIIPLGSHSKTNDLIAKKLKKMLPHTTVLYDFIQKDVWKNVELSKIFYDKMRQRKAVGKDLTHFLDVARNLKAKKINHGNEPFTVSGLKASDRLYYSMFYKFGDGTKIDAIRGLVGKNILFVDDTLEAGATILEAIRLLTPFRPASFSAYILLFGRNTTKAKLPKDA